MLSRTISLTVALATTTLVGLQAQAPGHAYVDDFGIEAPIVANSNSFIATYYGWEGTTVFGHEIYVMTVSQYNTDLANGCFAFYSIYRSNCLGVANLDLGGLLGLPLFGKPLGVTCAFPAQACFGNPLNVAFGWTAGTEMVFALGVNQGLDGELNTPDYNWFFSGDPNRNTNADGQPSAGTGFAHLAFWPNGVGGNRGVGTVPGTSGKGLFGFEDVGFTNSDWDFDNAIFGLQGDLAGFPSAVTPEPATLAMLGTGLAGLGAFARTRRRRKAAGA